MRQLRQLHPVFWIQCLVVTVMGIIITTAAYAQEKPQRIVSVGGAVTEIIYALGEEHRLVARDTTSNYPEAALELPDVGYIRRLSPEGVLSVNPDMIIAQEGAGPPEAVELLQTAAIPFVEIPEGFSVEAISAKINAVAAALEVPEKGAALAKQVEAELAEAAAATVDHSGKRVLFILSMQGGRILAAGQNTSAEAIIELAGGENALSGFEGFKNVTDEAVSTSGADVILMMDRTGDHALDDEALFLNPALAATPAAQNKSVVRMDGILLLGFSVRTPEAVLSLSKALKNAGS